MTRSKLWDLLVGRGFSPGITLVWVAAMSVSVSVFAGADHLRASRSGGQEAPAYQTTAAYETARTFGQFAQGSAQTKARFRVCADPQNMPFSNDKLEGFENRIAELVAGDFGAIPSYIWWGQRQGFIRNTMNATLEDGRCDIVIGVPDKYDLVLTTRPYYRSTYVFVYPKGKTVVRSLDDPALKTLKIGVHLIGDDYANPPPVHELSRRGIVSNVVGFSTFYSAENPPSTIIDAVAQRRIDVAVVWGPVAGYYASRQRVPLQIVPVPSKKGDLPFTFGIAMGVKRGNEPLRRQLQQVLDRRQSEITGILRKYGVPLVD